MVLTALSMAAHPTILNVPGYILMIPIGEPIKTPLEHPTDVHNGSDLSIV